MTLSDPAGAGIIVREAEPADGRALVDTVVRINHETDFLGDPSEPPPWADQPAAYLASVRASGEAVFFVAADGAALVGYLWAAVPRFASCRGAVFIYAVGRLESHRGRGIGGRLLAALEAWARARAAWRLELRVDVENPRALALYRRCGFEVEGRLALACRVAGAWREHYWMAKLLDADARAPVAAVDLTPPPVRRDGCTVAIRPEQPSDAAALIRFELAGLAESGVFLIAPGEVATDVAQRAKQIAEGAADPRRTVLVARARDGTIVGGGGIWREPWARFAHDAVCQVNVLRAWSGCGIGQRLAGALERWAVEQGVRRMTAALQANNVRGRRFAAARGFQPEVVMRRYARIGDQVGDRIRVVRLLP
jgi:RimJ/RimL family protein N-acetyltransferase